MPITAHSPKLALLADAAASGATGLVMAAGSAPLSELLNIPQPLLLWAGLALLPFALLVVATARRSVPDRSSVIAIVVVNVLWTIASFAILALLPSAPTLLGMAFVILQSTVVGAFAILQFRLVGAAARIAASAA